MEPTLEIRSASATELPPNLRIFIMSLRPQLANRRRKLAAPGPGRPKQVIEIGGLDEERVVTVR